MKNKNGLTDKQERFCEFYVESLNGTRSYMKAYGLTNDKYDTARTESSKQLAKPNVLARIKELQQEAKEKMCITPDFIVQKAMEVYDKASKATPVLKWNYETKKMEETGEYVFDSKGANGALDLIAAVSGLKQTKVDAKIQVDTPIIKDDI